MVCLETRQGAWHAVLQLLPCDAICPISIDLAHALAVHAKPVNYSSLCLAS